MKIVSFVVALLTLVISCSSKKQTLSLEITNTANDSVQLHHAYVNIGVTKALYTDSLDLNAHILAPYKTVLIGWELNDLPSSDGNFIVSYEINDSIHTSEFGYFTSGRLLDKSYSIELP
ncbi:MAG: hypothetical protein MI922_12530 [Bacteroidales bacterium]|nr:hypothetical protein [Bacteroidales bacterium]